MLKILIAEDDNAIRSLLEDLLAEWGYTPVTASNGQEALALLEQHYVDLILTDVEMPVMDGFELIYQLRRSGYQLPILMVTAYRTLEDMKKGYQLGADDYITKPFQEEELLLRIGALLRRCGLSRERCLQIGNTVLHYDAKTVTVGQMPVLLPRKEFQLLYQLLSNCNRVLSRRQLLDEVWDYDTDSNDHTVDVHINRLRKRFAGSRDFTIQTVRSVGYKAIRLAQDSRSAMRNNLNISNKL